MQISVALLLKIDEMSDTARHQIFFLDAIERVPIEISLLQRIAADQKLHTLGAQVVERLCKRLIGIRQLKENDTVAVVDDFYLDALLANRVDVVLYVAQQAGEILGIVGAASIVVKDDLLRRVGALRCGIRGGRRLTAMTLR